MRYLSKKTLVLLVKSSGNISILALAAVLITGFTMAALFDCCRIFAARSQAKNASDSITLAIAQNLLFFDEESMLEIAKDIAYRSNCNITEVQVTYDEVTVKIEKSVHFILIDKLGYWDCKVFSSSSSKVIFPWDQVWGMCDIYKFEY